MDEMIITNRKKELCMSEVVLPQCAYSSGVDNEQTIKVYYISDIHLHWHVRNHARPQCEISAIVKELFTDELMESIKKRENIFVVFAGDMSKDISWNNMFFSEFTKKWDSILREEWEKNNIQMNPMSLEEAENKYISELKSLSEKEEVREIEVENMKLQKGYIISYYCRGNQYIPKKEFPIFVVLGNHELNQFDTVENAVTHYKEVYNKCGIHFLHNEYVHSNDVLSYSWCYNGFLILGGTGFAKFNEKYNANSLIGAWEMTREEEIKESEKFFDVYQKALCEATENNKLLVVLTHYPVKDWLPEEKYNSRCVYFSGHTHRNDSVHTDTINIHANNQIGYHKKEFKFKYTMLGACYNPFIDYGDGTHEITKAQYVQFCDFCNDSIVGSRQMDNYLKSRNARLFMIKKHGFYGFFLVCSNADTKICAGGMIRNISKIRNIDYFENCFYAMVNHYVATLLPYRRIQERISEEVKALGYSGRIHGCIVDVNYYNHIMLNPLDGKITYYYSPVYGRLRRYNSFLDLLLNIDDYGVSKYIEQKEKAVSLFEKNKADVNYFLCNNCDDMTSNVEKIVKIELKNSVYSISRKMKQFQRLFDSNVLRDWDDRIAQIIVNNVTDFLSEE